jgi:hypothetical protein
MKVPVPHDVQELAAAAEYLPAVHAAQPSTDTEPVALLAFPAGQDEQLVEVASST